MPQKKSVSITDKSVPILKSLCTHGMNWSGSINEAIQRYKLFSEYCLPELTQAEKNALAQAYNGYLFDRGVEQDVKQLHWQVGEAIQYDENVVENLASEDIDPSKFIEKVKSWSPAERLAVIHFVNEFWSTSKNLEE